MSNQDNTNHNKPVIGISIGDLNGIGPEVIIYALSDQRILNMVTPVIYGSTKVLSYYRKLFKLDDFNYSQIKRSQQSVPQKSKCIQLLAGDGRDQCGAGNA